MIDFLEILCSSLWNRSVAFYDLVATSFDKNWIIVVIGIVAVVIAFLCAMVKVFDIPNFTADLLDNGILIVANAFMFIVQYFNDFQVWSDVNGVAGFFAWISSLTYVLTAFSSVVLPIILPVCYFVIGIVHSLFEDGFRYFSHNILFNFTYMLKGLASALFSIVCCWLPLQIGLLLTSSVTGPILVCVFFIVALLHPTSNKVGTFEDRQGNLWEVWRN